MLLLVVHVKPHRSVMSDNDKAKELFISLITIDIQYPDFTNNMIPFDESHSDSETGTGDLRMSNKRRTF